MKPEDTAIALLKKTDDVVKEMNVKMQAAIAEKLKKISADLGKADRVGDQTQSAIPVSLALKAIHYGASRVALRVLPRVAIDFLDTVKNDFLGKLGISAVGKTALKKIPVVGQIGQVIFGAFNEAAYNARMQAMLRDVLGSESNVFENAPMRWAINKHVERVKIRTEAEPRRSKKVTTRKTDNE